MNRAVFVCLVVLSGSTFAAQEDPRDRAAERAASQAAPASVPVDLSGEWDPLFHEDYPDRMPGPELGDYLGLPINEAARQYAESWDAARMSLPEHQCMVHVAPYLMRGPGAFRVWQERDPDTQRLVALKLFHGIFQQTRTSGWMGGRTRTVHAAYLDGVFDRSVGRRHSHRLHDAHQAGMDTAEWRSGK